MIQRMLYDSNAAVQAAPEQNEHHHTGKRMWNETVNAN